MIKKQTINILYYVIGFFVVGLGVNVMEISNLGLGAWDTVTFNLHAYLIQVLNMNPDVVLVGFVSAVISLTIMIMILLYRRKVKYLFLLVPVLLMGNVINFWYYLIFNQVQIEAFYLQLLFFILGVLLIPLGLVMIVKSSFPAFVFDEWTFMLSDILHINFGTARLMIEIFGISLGALFGYLTYYQSEGHLGDVSVGTLIVALLFGPLMQFYLKLFKVKKEA